MAASARGAFACGPLWAAARDWAEWAQVTARQPAASGSPATTIPPGLSALLRLTSPGAASSEAYANQCRMLLVHL
ncbi:hypothetical protein, partial [Paenibacillus pabuli]|uniref:hypothetical protein n=1 Tax=Paenibacillus pabuli TaxID=1472 RepID=UPI002DB63C33